MLKNYIEKIKNIRKLIVLRRRPDIVAYKPIYLQIEPTTRCNLNCIMCDSSRRKKGASKDMSFEDFTRIIDQIPSLKKVNLQGVGEPLLSKHIFNMIEYCISKNIDVGFASNATLIDCGMAEKIAKSGLSQISLSLDAATPEIYKQTRDADFNKLIENIKGLVKARDKLRSRLKLSINFVATKNNISKLPDMIRFTADLGIRDLLVIDIHYWGKDAIKKKIDKLKIGNNHGSIKEMCLEAEDIAKMLGVTLSFLFSDKKMLCTWPWLSSYISVEGFVTPCCVHGSDPGNVNFGNIFQTPFYEIWNSKMYVDFRRRLKNRPIPDICVGCPAFECDMLRGCV